MAFTTLVAAAALAAPVLGAVAPTFYAPSTSPFEQSGNYTGKSNGTLVNSAVVPGAAFDRIIHIWLENTDFDTAASAPTFQKLAKDGIIASAYHGVTHPSEPNYIAAVSGDFFGNHDDAYYHIPSNVSTVVDLLEEKNISWASYQENQPWDGYTGFNYTEQNYLNASAGGYGYYVRKHNPLIIHDSVESVKERALRIRNFNDFAVDVTADALPQWMFITPNMVNDAHDTDVEFTSAWLEYFLVPLLADNRFNNNRTLVVLTFDETETYSINNRVFTLFLGGAIPSELVGTTDPTFYSHYSDISTVTANWGLKSLGRQDTNKTVSNVYAFVANQTGYVNNDLNVNSTNLPLLNLTGVAPGPLNPTKWTPVLSPNVSAIGASGQGVFLAANNDATLTSATPLNLTAAQNPDETGPGYDYQNGVQVSVGPAYAAVESGITKASASVATATGSAPVAAATTTAKSGAVKVVAAPLAVAFSTLVAAAFLAAPVFGAVAPTFYPPGTGPFNQSGNYTGVNNGTIVNTPLVAGKAFDHATAASSATFQKLAKQGILANGYFGVTHPSEPNYLAAATGSFFGLGGDTYSTMPQNVSTMVDLLEAKNISWASYQESMPWDGFTGFNYTQPNYLNASAGDYTYYVRKHSPFIICDSVATVEKRALRHRNFNDFAVDVTADALPQWMFITPNIVNDAHDTDIEFVSSWLEYWLVPLLADERFNNNRTLIVLTWDENETYAINNNIYTLFLGGAIPANLVGTQDDTYYTHYSSLSSAQNNWGLGSLGRGDTNKTLANVYSFVANQTGYVNNGLTINSTDLPLTNLTNIFDGPLHPAQWTPVLSPNVSAVGAGGGAVFVDASNNASLTSWVAQNLTGDAHVPDMVGPGFDWMGNTSVSVATDYAETLTGAAFKTAAATATGSVAVAAAATTTAKSVAFSTLVAAAFLAAPALAAVAPTFYPPSTSPFAQSGNYTGANNGTIINSPYITGAAFDRIIHIWLENTDFATAASSSTFQNLAKQGILASGYHGNTHPSEPNYLAAATGSFWGLGGDAYSTMPQNVSTIVDLLEAKNISWASYQENLPWDGYTGFNYTQPNYLNASAGEYAYYVRKHSPLIIANSVATVKERALRHRNFNDFAVDVTADALPQWMFITPNMVNDAHDTDIEFTSAWLEYFLVPLLADTRFNSNRTLIVLTFDETETYTINNQLYTLFLGGAIPSDLVGTTDPTYYTHYSDLSSVQANWGLGSLGRGDTNKTLANVYSFVANQTGYVNNGLTINSTDLPLTNLTGIFDGPLNPAQWTPVLSPNVTAVGAGGGAVFLDPSNNASLTSWVAQNLSASTNVPDETGPGFDWNGNISVSVGTNYAAALYPTSTAAATATGSVAVAAAATTTAKSGAVKVVAGPLAGLLALVAAFAL